MLLALFSEKLLCFFSNVPLNSNPFLQFHFEKLFLYADYYFCESEAG